jgi:hypothetical protein
MKKAIFSLIVLTLVSLTIEGQGQPRVDANRTVFVKQAMSRVEAKNVSSEQAKLLQEKVAKWEETRGEKDWIALTEAVHEVAESLKAQATVEISTSRGTNATVKYQTLGGRERKGNPTTAKGLTKLEEDMIVGVYHIWSEREGKATSDTNAQFEIVKVKERVKLEETK